MSPLPCPLLISEIVSEPIPMEDGKWEVTMFFLFLWVFVIGKPFVGSAGLALAPDSCLLLAGGWRRSLGSGRPIAGGNQKHTEKGWGRQQ